MNMSINNVGECDTVVGQKFWVRWLSGSGEKDDIKTKGVIHNKQGHVFVYS